MRERMINIRMLHGPDAIEAKAERTVPAGERAMPIIIRTLEELAPEAELPVIISITRIT